MEDWPTIPSTQQEVEQSIYRPSDNAESLTQSKSGARLPLSPPSSSRDTQLSLQQSEDLVIPLAERNADLIISIVV